MQMEHAQFLDLASHIWAQSRVPIGHFFFGGYHFFHVRIFLVSTIFGFYTSHVVFFVSVEIYIKNFGAEQLISWKVTWWKPWYSSPWRPSLFHKYPVIINEHAFYHKSRWTFSLTFTILLNVLILFQKDFQTLNVVLYNVLLF